MSTKLVPTFGPGRSAIRTIALAACTATVTIGAVLASAVVPAAAETPTTTPTTTTEQCGGMSYGAACTIDLDHDAAQVSVTIPSDVTQVTAIVAGAGGSASQAPLGGGWTTVGTFTVTAATRSLSISLGSSDQYNGQGGGTSAFAAGDPARASMLVDSYGGSTDSGYYLPPFDGLASFPNREYRGSVELIPSAAIDLAGDGSHAPRTLDLPAGHHRFRYFVGGGSGSRGHNQASTEGYGALVSGILDTGSTRQLEYWVGQSAYNGGGGYGVPGAGGQSDTPDGKDGGDGGGATMLATVHATGNPTAQIAAGGGGGAGGGLCSVGNDSCTGYGGGRGGSAGGDTAAYQPNGSASHDGTAGGLAGAQGSPSRPSASGGDGESVGSYIGESAGAGGGGGAGYPRGGQGGWAGAPSARHAGGGGGAGASYVNRSTNSQVEITTVAQSADGYIILIPIS